MTAEQVLREILLGDAYTSWEQHIVNGKWVRRPNARFIIDGHITLTPEAGEWIDSFYESEFAKESA